MSYLNQPGIFFSGKFRGDPSTVNNTPDNFNPNNLFPPDNGKEIGNNIQLYWNPDGAGVFELDCTITKVVDENGKPMPKSPLLGQPLTSASHESRLHSAKLVDLDPMQQNVTELWGLQVQFDVGEKVGGIKLSLVGDFTATAYANAWIQVVGGRGSYAGSAQYQSVLTNTDPELSISFVVRSHNATPLNYLINETNLKAMNTAKPKSVPESVTNKLTILEHYNQSAEGQGTPGQIPTTKYFEKLVNALLGCSDASTYLETIKSSSVQPYILPTDFHFTWGQVFGVIGPHKANEPNFFTADRMMTPPCVTSDTATYAAYFAPFTVTSNSVIVNLGNSLPSTQPASKTHSYVKKLGELFLCYFEGSISLAHAMTIGEIKNYSDIDFYLKDAGLVTILVDSTVMAEIEKNPLGIISNVNGKKTILLQENVKGLYLRADQFVFRMNPGVAEGKPESGTQTFKIYATQWGQPLKAAKIKLTLKTAAQAEAYTNATLGTGGTTGLVNISKPQSALTFNVTCTDDNGVATATLTATDPGNPRGYIDGQIYFLNYGFSDSDQSEGYIQSPDDVISVHVYTQQPNIADITWENFVKGTLGQYAKLYPVMAFLDLGNEQSVITHAQEIYDAISREITNAALMPVTRDLSASRLELLKTWLKSQIKSQGSE